MPNYGVIDLGSNSVRLVVYEVKDDRRPVYTNKDFRSLLNDKVMAGLAAYVREAVFTQAGVERAASVLKGHLKRARYFQCKRIDVFATAVLRNCDNSAEAVTALQEAAGTRIALLSARDEAHLGFVGATCDRVIERGTLVDIGGGSTDLSRSEGGQDFANTSIPQGSLSSYADHVAAILPTQREVAAIAQSLWERACALPDPDAYRTPRFYGIGGSVRAAAKMHAQAFGDLARPRMLAPQQLASLLDLLRDDPDRFAHQAVKAVPERVHTLVPGCVIAHTLLAGFGAQSLEICKYGLREGYLVERMLEGVSGPGRPARASSKPEGVPPDPAPSSPWRDETTPRRAPEGV